MKSWLSAAAQFGHAGAIRPHTHSCIFWGVVKHETRVSRASPGKEEILVHSGMCVYIHAQGHNARVTCVIYNGNDFSDYLGAFYS